MCRVDATEVSLKAGPKAGVVSTGLDDPMDCRASAGATPGQGVRACDFGRRVAPTSRPHERDAPSAPKKRPWPDPASMRGRNRTRPGEERPAARVIPCPSPELARDESTCRIPIRSEIDNTGTCASARGRQTRESARKILPHVAIPSAKHDRNVGEAQQTQRGKQH
jgi:hypothetical protein